MKQTHLIARQIRGAFFGDNWCGISLRKAVEDLPFDEAMKSLPHSHSIAALVFHIGYYFQGVEEVLRGGTLVIRDQYSFEMPPITNESEWRLLLDRTWQQAESFIGRVEKLPDDLIDQTFVDEKYGDYYRNLTGLVEHLYYHLGQIALIKKGVLV